MPAIPESEVMWYSVPPFYNNPVNPQGPYVGLYTVEPPPSVDTGGGWNRYGPAPFQNPVSPTSVPLFKKGEAEAFDGKDSPQSRYEHRSPFGEYAYFATFSQGPGKPRYSDFNGWGDVGVSGPAAPNTEHFWCAARVIRTIPV